MKKIILAIALILLAGNASSAFAAMPNASISGYKQPQHCVIPPDRAVYEINAEGLLVVSGCYTPEAWNASQTNAIGLQSSGIRFASGTSVELKTGKREQCAVWYGGIDCIVAKVLVK